MKMLSYKIPGPDGPVEVDAPAGIPSGISFGSLVTAALSVATLIGIVLALAYLVYGGIYWIQASGDKQKLDKARRILIYAVVGLLVMSVSLVVVNTVAAALGVKTLFAGSN